MREISLIVSVKRNEPSTVPVVITIRRVRENIWNVRLKQNSDPLHNFSCFGLVKLYKQLILFLGNITPRSRDNNLDVLSWSTKVIISTLYALVPHLKKIPFAYACLLTVLNFFFISQTCFWRGEEITSFTKTWVHQGFDLRPTYNKIVYFSMYPSFWRRMNAPTWCPPF
jgi:hypothetical protein